jgi:hypothetical protein
MVAFLLARAIPISIEDYLIFFAHIFEMTVVALKFEAKKCKPWRDWAHVYSQATGV